MYNTLVFVKLVRSFERKALPQMANDTPSGETSRTEPLNSATKLFTIGSELLREVQQHVGQSKIRSLRLTLGGRPIKDFPVSPATAIASIVLVILAVIITNLKVEVIKDMEATGDADNGVPTTPTPGGAK
jgi:hypothetical protein